MGHDTTGCFLTNIAVALEQKGFSVVAATSRSRAYSTKRCTYGKTNNTLRERKREMEKEKTYICLFDRKSHLIVLFVKGAAMAPITLAAVLFFFFIAKKAFFLFFLTT